MTRKYIIVDDEKMPHQIIKNYCDLLPNMLLMKNCYDAIEAMDYLNEHSVDLMFLDLNMPKLKGFDFLRTLQNPPQVIVTTAHKEFALESYDLNVVDYLLKPFSFERFLKAINKAFASKANNASALPSDDSNNNALEKSIFLNSNNKYFQVKLADILYVEASGNYCKIVLQNETMTLREKLSSVLEMLPQEYFFQVHRSFIVAAHHIKVIDNWNDDVGFCVIGDIPIKGNRSRCCFTKNIFHRV